MTDKRLESDTIRRVGVRLLPMLFLLYVFAYIDRVNVGIAALQMNAQLGFSAATFGFGAGVFFLGYALFEVPSNLILVRVGARRWLARIAITWGLLSCATALVSTPTQFYIARFLLGVAEAGLFPGVVYYLSYWFPATHRARAISAFVLAIPLAQTVAAPLSGALLTLSGVGRLAGWQWVFLMEGLPSALVGLAVLRYLPERPEDASWLAMEQRQWLSQRIGEEQVRSVSGHHSLLRSLAQPLVWALVVPYFAYYTFALAFVFWTPTLLKEALHTGDSATALIAGAIALVGALGYPLAGWMSDRSGERCGLAALGLALGAAGCLGLTTFSTATAKIVGLTAINVCSALFMTSFWCLPTKLLKGSSAAAGIALVNALGSSGGFFGPSIVGFFRDLTGSDGRGLLVLASFAAAGAIACMVLRIFDVFREKSSAIAIAT